jgi:1D-myo-inositol 3-kinase
VRRPPKFDYTTVGHVTIDVMADGSRRLGGSAFYSALQAARLDQRTLILTRGSVREIGRLMAPYRGEIELQILPARETTTLATIGSDTPRRQRVLAWAGPIEEAVLDTSILHLAPVARETPRAWRGRAGFVGLTPQGLTRSWDEQAGDGQGGEMYATPLDRGRLPDDCDAIVLSEHERASCTDLISAARKTGSVVAITGGANPTSILLPGGEVIRAPAHAIEHPRDDLGAGDVFAAAFFVSLAEGQPPARAAAFANAAAAVRIGDVGADAIGDRPTIEAQLRATAVASKQRV